MLCLFLAGAFYSALKIKSFYFLKTGFYSIKVIWLHSANYRDFIDIKVLFMSS